MKIATRYAIFAVIAGLANFGSQAAIILVSSGAWNAWIAMLAGTAVGMVVKYYLDRRWIYGFRSDSLTHEGRTFSLYTLFSILTTALFWGFEMGFFMIFNTTIAQFTGGAIGLTLGYVAKYQFDKKFTFRGAAGEFSSRKGGTS
jgi:putative flippase GtrA